MTDLIEKFTESLPSWGARLAYGEKTTIDGHDLLPVAFVVFGFGAGEGSGEQPASDAASAGRGEGSGAGGGGYSLPIGAYVAGPGGIRFRANPVALIAVAVPLVSALGWALARTRR